MSKQGKSQKFVSLGRVLPKVLRELHLEELLHGRRLVEKWPEAVGEIIARHTCALSFEDGTLLVSVDSPGWINQLIYLKPRLFKALAKYVKRGTIKDIRFVLKHSRPQPQ